MIFETVTDLFIFSLLGMDHGEWEAICKGDLSADAGADLAGL
jgi:hypothetical protein